MADSAIAGIRSALFTIITSLREVLARLQRVTRIVSAIVVIVAKAGRERSMLATNTWSNASIMRASIAIVTAR